MTRLFLFRCLFKYNESMSEKFPVPQAENLVGRFEDFKSDFYDDSFIRGKESENNGEVISDPKEVLRRLFEEYSTGKLENELEKSERDKEIIKIAIEAVKSIAAEYGREDFVEITENHIHLFPDGGVEELTKGRLAVGSHATVLGEAFVDRRDDLATAITTFHELWHTLASYNAIQITTEGDLDWYRSGFSIQSRDGEKKMFHYLDEALVGHATKRFVDEVLRQHTDFAQLIEQIEVDGGEIDTTRQRELGDFLKYLDIVLERNNEGFSDRTEILNMFMRAQVTGNLLPVARLIEKTFGKGAFRKLSEF
jgi:hypothetical protein